MSLPRRNPNASIAPQPILGSTLNGAMQPCCSACTMASTPSSPRP